MLDINWGDVVNLLSLCTPYLITLGVILVVGIAAIIAAMKLPKAAKFMVRCQAGVAMVLALVLIVNMICFNQFSTMLTLAFGDGTLTDASIDMASDACLTIAEEGVVLLENRDNALPLTANSNLNVFGWASTNPCYGGTGSGALNDAFEKVTLLEGLENAGFRLNTSLSDFYTAYRADHPEMGPAVQDWTLPEPPANTYPAALISEAQSFSDTALIVLSRIGAEAADVPVKVDPSFISFTDNTADYQDFPDGKTLLDPSQSELDMIDLVCQNFDKVIVVLNGSNTMNLSFVRDHSQIKSVVWCAGPGQNGFNALGTVLNGATNPSGRSPDTFITDFGQAPYIHNFGDFHYENMTELEGKAWGRPTTPTFVNYVEGLYVGYRFYETAAVEGLIDYDKLVQYPFGHGLSYTTFKQEMSPLSVSGSTISFDVTVTNTGSAPGKDVVEVYYNPPYINGGIEKSAANLLDFAKTGELAPGASEKITFTFEQEDMASFDNKVNGCYVLDAGDYVISINADSHTILDSQTYTLGSPVIYNEASPRSTDQTAAVSHLGFEEGVIEYLSRADGFANYDQVVASPSLTLDEQHKAAFLYNDNYVVANYNTNDPVPTTEAKNGLTLADLRGLGYNDAKWDSLLDQLTVSDMMELIALGGYSTVAASSVGKVATTDCDGPASINNNFTGVGSIGFPSATMIASTWNKDLALLFGEGIGKMADEMNVSGWYAPAMNIHRSAFCGRNFEYYSEDSVLSGYMASNAVKGAAEYGVYAYIKHFALNDQETNRQSMLCTWSTEQATREIYLKPFEIAVKQGGAMAVMSSYNYIGVTYAGACKATLTDILRGEWGFQGFVLTDYNANFSYMNSDQIIRNGGDACLATYDNGANYVTDTTSGTALTNMRRACKNIMYTVVNSRAYYDENLNPGTPAWKIIFYVVDVVVILAAIALEFVIVKGYKKRKSA